MLIYEKENKLNINFDNEVSEQPDLQISKEDGKTSVKIDGQESGGGSGSGVFSIPIVLDGGTATTTVTREEVSTAIASQKRIVFNKAPDTVLATKLRSTEDSVVAYAVIVKINNSAIAYYEYGVNWSLDRAGNWLPVEVTYKVTEISRN